MVRAAAEHDAADPVTAAAPRSRHDRIAILAAAEALHLPHIRIHTGVLELADGLDRDGRAQKTEGDDVREHFHGSLRLPLLMD
jgi:hypothetical protein